MKRKQLVSILGLLLLVSCTNTSSLSLSQGNSTPSSVVASQSVNSASSSVEEDPLLDEREDYSHLPHLNKVESLKKTRDQWNGAKYIWYEKNPSDVYVAFRKKFTLANLPEKAVLSLSGDSKVTVWVNSQLAVIDGNIKRGMTQYDSFYSDYDIKEYLTTGENVLVFEVNYWGQSSNNSISSGQGGLLFDLDLGVSHIVSDESVKVKRIDAYRNKSQLKENYPNHPTSPFLAERDIYFDARLALDFTKKNFDDSLWKEATLVGLVGTKPFGDTYSCDLPPFAFDKTITEMKDPHHFLNKKTTEKTILTFSLDENQQFLPYFELDADEEGKVITFYTNTKTTQKLTSFMDDYVTKKGSQSYEQWYYRTGYQFIMEVPEGITIKKVGYRKTGYHANKVGNYVSDDEKLNVLWQKAYNTMKICMRDNYMDCPERERSPYTGDAANQIAETLYSLDQDGWKLAKKTYLTLLGWIKEDKIIPTRWPSSTTNEIPMQNLAAIITSYDYYLHTGDEETMKLVYPIFNDYLKLWETNSDGSIKYRDGSFPWVDWGENTDQEIMEQCWYYLASDTLLKLGESVSLLTNEDKLFYETRRANMKAIFRSKFYTNEGFATLLEDKQERKIVDDRANALAALSGLADKEDYPLIKSVLENKKYASPYMERFVLEALCHMGYYQEAKERMLSRYEEMIDYEASTLWETWSPESDSGTINHGWAGGPLVVLSKYFAGIKPLSAGFKEYEIKPSVVNDNYEASIQTPEGILSYTLKKESDAYRFTLSCPKDGGKLILDEKYGNDITLDGQNINTREISLSKGNHIIVTK